MIPFLGLEQSRGDILPLLISFLLLLVSGAYFVVALNRALLKAYLITIAALFAILIGLGVAGASYYSTPHRSGDSPASSMPEETSVPHRGLAESPTTPALTVELWVAEAPADFFPTAENMAIDRLRKTEGVDVIAAPRVTFLNGQEIQIGITREMAENPPASTVLPPAGLSFRLSATLVNNRIIYRLQATNVGSNKSATGTDAKNKKSSVEALELEGDAVPDVVLVLPNKYNPRWAASNRGRALQGGNDRERRRRNPSGGPKAAKADPA